ncbi:MAG: calcium/sodium antiporter [Halothiobacillaceae bacterium]|jgi:cation:H+ antiporter|nr:calcium/sodium antiporter [Halothiobacillaceae bacterium]
MFALLPAFAAVAVGLIALAWSADRFVEGAAVTARHLGVPALLVGMLVIGFGTSAPELLVSVTAAGQGNAALALGNAIGSNIVNIALILGLTAVIAPIAVHSGIIRREIPLLMAVTALFSLLALDGGLTRLDGALLVLALGGIVGWSIWQARRHRDDALSGEVELKLQEEAPLTPGRAWLWLAMGLLVLLASSRLLVWGAVEIAQAFGVSDLVIGLTIVALGTSLPELASSIVAARRGEPDLALGNVIGSNLFNTLGVIGVAVLIQPFAVAGAVLWRDLPVMIALTLGMAAMAWGFTSPGRLTRVEGAVLVFAYLSYTLLLLGTRWP